MSAKEHNPNAPNRPTMNGMTIGDFEILGEIGRGGMGVVYRARQLSLDRIVALKILAYGRGLSDQAVTRFQREAQATAKLHHPNIVPVYAQGHQDNIYFYAMELVSGTSLYDAICQLRQGGGPDIGKSRDRSPSSSDPKMTDRPSSGGSSGKLAETELLERPAGGSTSASPGQRFVEGDSAGSRGGSRAGAVGFESHTDEYFDTIAQQIRNVADALGYAHENGVIHRDIKPHNLLFGSGDRLCLSDFGLARIVEQPGVTQTGDFVGSPLYMSPEQITGRGGEVGVRSDIYSLGATLYEWMTLSPPFPGTTREQVISRVMTEDPPTPHSINRRIPHDLETICLKAMSRDQSRRYASAKELSNDLGRFLNRSNIKARRAGLVETIGKTISRYRVATVVCIAAILIAALSSALIRQKSDSQSAKESIIKKQELVDSVTEKNKQLEERLQSEEDVNPIAEPMQRGEQLASIIKGPLSSLLSFGGDDQDAPVTDSQRIGAMFVARMREAETQRLANVPPGTVAPDSAEGLYISALADDNPDDAVAKLDACLKLEADHMPARLLRAWHQCRLNNIPAMKADAKAVLDREPNSAEGLLARAVARIFNDRFELAIEDVDRAALKLGSDIRTDLLRGIALAGLGRGRDALNEMNLVLIIEPDNIIALMTRAKSLYEVGRFGHAIVDLTRVIEQEPNRADAFELRGDCYDELGQYEEASADILHAMTIAPNYELAMKYPLVLAKADQQRMQKKEELAKSEQGDSDPEVGHSEMPDPSKDGAVKSWLEKLIDDSKNKKNELRSFRLTIPSAS